MHESPEALRQRRARAPHDNLYDRRRGQAAPPETDPMSASPQLVGATIRGPGGARSAPEAAWELLGLAAGAFTLIALVDLVLLFVPARVGDSRWEFEGITALLGGMPLLFVGLLLGYASGYARERAGILRLWSLLALMIAAVLLVAFADYLLRIPPVLAAAESTAERSELLKAIVRTSCQGVAYPGALFWLGIRGWVQAAHT
jgi:hypothetical protein